MKWFYWLTGGRPMRQIDFACRDHIAHKDVFYAEDKFGRRWLTTGRWAWFRVPHEEYESNLRALTRD